MEIHDGYTREMYDHYGFFACWLPNTRIALGDIGTVRGRRFDKLTSLAELGVDFTEDEPSVRGELEYTTAGSVDVMVKSEASVAGLTITFTGKGATFFQARGCVLTGIANLPVLGSKLERLPEWRSEYVVVTKLLRTGPATILVSSEEGATVDVTLDPQALADPLPLAMVNSRFTISRSSSLAARVTVEEGATPLFHAMRLHRPLLAKPKLRWRSGGLASDSPLTAVTWDEFAQSA